MIISASRRTDIPAFYTEWLMNRIRAGFFYRVNPFNAHQISAFSLAAEHVDAICFWTKNPQPLLRHVGELDERGLNYYFQFTLNPYDPVFEPRVPALASRLDSSHRLAHHLGPQRVVWRYDPVILTSATPVSWHLEQCEMLASRLAGATRRLVFSFYDYYGKGQGRLHAALQGSGITLADLTSIEYRSQMQELVAGFSRIAAKYQLGIFSCSEELDLAGYGVEHGTCIDGALITELFDSEPIQSKDKNQRDACGCVESVDMGSYNSCDFRCAYCYANFNEGTINSNRLKHDPQSPTLLGQCEETLPVQTGLKKNKAQLSLF